MVMIATCLGVGLLALLAEPVPDTEHDKVMPGLKVHIYGYLPGGQGDSHLPSLGTGSY